MNKTSCAFKRRPYFTKKSPSCFSLLSFRALGSKAKNRSAHLKKLKASLSPDQFAWASSHHILLKDLNPKSSRNLSNNSTWLGSSDIDFVLDSLEEYKSLRFKNKGGFDWSKRPRRIESFIKSIRNEHINNRKTRWGWYYNTAKWTQGTGTGSHWVAAIYHKNGNRFEFFDSFGNPPTQNIRKHLDFMAETFKKALNLKETPVLHIHNQRLQNDVTQCGVWTIWFIHNSLSHKTLDTMPRYSSKLAMRKAYFTIYDNQNNVINLTK